MNMWNKAVSRLQSTAACSRLCIRTARQQGARILLASTIGLGLMSQPALAAAKLSFQMPLVVKNDRGGKIRTRLIQMKGLRASGRKVEIRGRVCFSTCTMLLGLPNVCVSPKTVFGFHGPSRSGRQLAADEFQYYSEVIAQYYPSPLRRWYMNVGRNRISGVYRISGQQVIDMGYKAC